MAHIVDRIEQREGGILYIHRPGLYFGYGLESDPEAMEAILEHEVVAELGVFAVNRQLGVQEVDQIPDVSAEEFGGKSPLEIVDNRWRTHTDVPFSSYVTLDSENRSDVVRGTLYEVKTEDVLRLNKFDLATPPVWIENEGWSFPGWRYMDRTVELADGRKAETLTIYPEQSVDRVVDGTDYDPYLNDKATTLKIIAEIMSES